MQGTTSPTLSYADLRQTMVDCQIRTFDVTDYRLIGRLLEVPREKFLSPDLSPLAYSDSALTIHSEKTGETRSLLPPFVLARMIQGAEVTPQDKVLDIASATGYSTALLAGLAGEVVALESDAGFCAEIATNLKALGLDKA